MERSEIKPFIAKRVAKELHDGDVVNLGIGLPTLVPDFLDPSVKLTLQSENGFILQQLILKTRMLITL